MARSHQILKWWRADATTATPRPLHGPDWSVRDERPQQRRPRVRAVERRFHAAGFRTAITSASGQRRGARHESLALNGDLVAFAPTDSCWPNFVAEVGGASKSVRQSLTEKRQRPLPASLRPIVVRLVDSRRRRWRWHLDSLIAYDSLEDLLAAVLFDEPLTA